MEALTYTEWLEAYLSRKEIEYLECEGCGGKLTAPSV